MTNDLTTETFGTETGQKHSEQPQLLQGHLGPWLRIWKRFHAVTQLTLRIYIKFYKQSWIFFTANHLFYNYFMAEARKCFLDNESKPSYF